MLPLRACTSLLAGAAGQGSTAIWTGYTRGSVAGSYGTDYLVRARVAQAEPGMQVPTQAVYEIRLPAGDLPPHGSDGFWSITLYNAAGFMVANPIDRYSIGDDTPGLVRGAGGSLTIVV